MTPTLRQKEPGAGKPRTEACVCGIQRTICQRPRQKNRGDRTLTGSSYEDRRAEPPANRPWRETHPPENFTKDITKTSDARVLIEQCSQYQGHSAASANRGCRALNAERSLSGEKREKSFLVHLARAGRPRSLPQDHNARRITSRAREDNRTRKSRTRATGPDLRALLRAPPQAPMRHGAAHRPWFTSRTGKPLSVLRRRRCAGYLTSRSQILLQTASWTQGRQGTRWAPVQVRNVRATILGQSLDGERGRPEVGGVASAVCWAALRGLPRGPGRQETGFPTGSTQARSHGGSQKKTGRGKRPTTQRPRATTSRGGINRRG